ncbi:MAG: WXG100 family type VII secretion target [Nocardioidaceae bacterium]
MAQIDTVVNGDSGACRRTAGWLGKLSSGVHNNGTAIRHARSNSESCWEGSAGAAFRGYIGKVATDADGLAGTTTSAQQALNRFADDLDTVNARINQARNVARNGGLTVTASAIQGPGPAPKSRVGPMALDEALRFHNAQADYSAKVKTYKEAKSTVDTARELEKTAHQNLTGPMRNATTTSEKLVTISSTVTGQALGVTKTLHSQAKELYDRANKLEKTAKRMQELTLNDDLSSAQRAAAAKLGTSTAAAAKKTRKGGKAFEKPIKKIPEGVRNKISSNPGQLLKESEGILKVTGKLLKPLGPVASAPSLISAGIEVANGQKTPVQAGTEVAFSLGGAAAGATSGGELGAAACSFVPGIGTAVCGTVGAIGGGLFGGLAGGKAADQLTGGH